VPVRVCGSCAKEWACWRDFILDPDLRLLGLQSVPDLVDGDLLVFDHCCGTSVSVFLRRLRPSFPDIEECDDPPGQAVIQGCPRSCQSLEEFVACDIPCTRARDRRLVRMILKLRHPS
jgi:hypothetical protein